METTRAAASKLAYELATCLEAEGKETYRRENLRLDGHIVRLHGPLAMTVACSDCIDDGRVTVYGPPNSELLVLNMFCLRGPFVLDLFVGNAAEGVHFECYYRSPIVSGAQKLLGHHVCSLFRSKALVIRPMRSFLVNNRKK